MTDNPTVLGTTKSIRTTVDGGMIATFEIAPQDVQKAFQAFGLAGTPVGIAPITAQAAQKAVVAETAKNGRRSFIELPRAQQAALRCREPEFWRFLNQHYASLGGIESDDGAAEYVRSFCGVNSRSAFDSDPAAGRRWDALEAEFYAYAHGRH